MVGAHSTNQPWSPCLAKCSICKERMSPSYLFISFACGVSGMWCTLACGPLEKDLRHLPPLSYLTPLKQVSQRKETGSLTEACCFSAKLAAYKPQQSFRLHPIPTLTPSTGVTGEHTGMPGSSCGPVGPHSVSCTCEAGVLTHRASPSL